ncbi:MAG: hypothetical protein ACE366_01035 [Bradymonadia bacterium]
MSSAIEDVHETAEASEDTAMTVLAGIALLMQFSPYSLDPDNDAQAIFAEIVRDHRPYMIGLTAEIDTALNRIEAGKEPPYRLVELPQTLNEILHGFGEVSGLDRTWACPPEGCFDHPAAQAFVQSVADECVRRLDAEITPGTDPDLVREIEVLGELALLLLLEPITIPSEKFSQWHSNWSASLFIQSEEERDELEGHNQCIRNAFYYGELKFTSLRGPFTPIIPQPGFGPEDVPHLLAGALPAATGWAWGEGILAMSGSDWVANISGQVMQAVRLIKEMPACETSAMAIIGAVHCLGRLDSGNLDPHVWSDWSAGSTPPTPFTDELSEILAVHRPPAHALTPEWKGLIADLHSGRTPSFYSGGVNVHLSRILHGEAGPQILEAGWLDGPPPHGLSHPAALDFAQRLADVCIGQIDQEVSRGLEHDLIRCDAVIPGLLSVLLRLPEVSINPDHFSRWRSWWYRGVVQMHNMAIAEGRLVHMDDLVGARPIEAAFNFGIERFSRR